MKTLPNGLTVFNGTPHVIRFWREGWAEPVEVELDEIINANIKDIPQGTTLPSGKSAEIVGVIFEQAVGGAEIADKAYNDGADVVLGSIVAAQAYPGRVFAMTPAPGYERVAPAEKRMRPDKFTTF